MSKFLKNTLARKKVMASSTISVLSAPHHSHGISHILKTQKKKTEQNRTESNGKETLIWNRSRSLNVALERKKRAPTSSTHSIFIHKTRMINLPMHNNNNNNNNNHFQLGINKLTTPPNYEFWISMNWIESPYHVYSGDDKNKACSEQFNFATPMLLEMKERKTILACKYVIVYENCESRSKLID